MYDIFTGEPASVYNSHMLKDFDGNVMCPVLYSYKCPNCGATKKNSHTIRHCPLSMGKFIIVP